MNNIAHIESTLALLILFLILFYFNLKYEYGNNTKEKGIYVFSIFLCIVDILRCSFLYGKFISVVDILYFVTFGAVGVFWILKNHFDKKNLKNLHLVVFLVGMIMSYLYQDGILFGMWYMLIVIVAEVIGQQYKTVRTDNLTKLKNRYGMDDEIHEQVEQYKHNKNDIFYVIACDMDEFKSINDTWGHDEGDRALKLVSSVLDEVSEKYNADAFRIGGDEFLIIADTDKEEKAKLICDEIKSMLSNIKFRDDYDLKISVGYARYNGEDDISKLLKCADEKLYEAKRKSKK